MHWRCVLRKYSGTASSSSRGCASCPPTLSCVALLIGAYSTQTCAGADIALELQWQRYGWGPHSEELLPAKETAPKHPPLRTNWGDWAESAHTRMSEVGIGLWQLGAQVGGCSLWFTSSNGYGALTRSGDWVLYSVDGIGSWAFGDWWPAVGVLTILALFALTTALLAYVIGAVCAPMRAFAKVWRSVRMRPSPTLVERLLPADNRGQSVKSIRWRGPARRCYPDADFYHLLRSRGTNRKPHDVLVRQGGQVIRLGLDLNSAERVDRQGLTIGYKDVKSCSHRQFRRWVAQRLEQPQK